VQPFQDHAECVPTHQLVPTFAQARTLSPEVCKTAPMGLVERTGPGAEVEDRLQQ
jgi:hypothetical protein